jgi:mono/diheme cytochrome c family protein
MNVRRRRSIRPFVYGRAATSAVGVLLLGVGMASCRGGKSSNPPIHPNLNMDFQYHLKAQEATTLFPDGRAMRPEIPGTIATDRYTAIPEFHTGRVGEGYVNELPMPLTAELLDRGQERYGIYCTPCHGGAGYSDGLVTQRGGMRPPSFYEDRLIAMPVGQIFESISKGVRGNMPAYGNKMNETDMWAVVAYVRALQLSQSAPLEAVPDDVARAKGWK